MSEEGKNLLNEDELERRARMLAETAEAAEESETFATIAVIAIGGASLGLPVDRLKEIVPRTAVTALPGLPPWISGIAQVRGVLMAVVHLGRWLGLAGMEAGPFFAVLDGPQGPLALEIDAVSGFRTVKTNEIAADLGTVDLKVAGLVRAATKDLVLILNPLELLGSKDIVVEMAAGSALAPAARPKA